VIHFCSIGLRSGNSEPKEQDQNQNQQNTPFALLAITDTDNNASDDGSKKKESNGNAEVNIAINNARCHLASKINEGGTLNSTSFLNLKYFLKGRLTASDLLKNVSPDGLPLLSIPNNTPRRIVDDDDDDDDDDDGCVPKSTTTYLKEVVVPYFDYAAYKDGSTFLSKLGLAMTIRPTVGVYQWPNNTTCIRPLPTGAEDQKLPSPSLIFHCESPENNEDKIKEYGFREARIGYGGLGRDRGHGQIMLLHKDLIGLDIRYCPRTKISSAFSEAQESLLAGSLETLQSTNVLLAGGEANDDKRIGNGDCWVEFKASIKRPSGYLRSKNASGKLKVAKVPDLPYE
jgi:hypothetical protein